jgi:DNA-binding response OmpR family regulator
MQRRVRVIDDEEGVRCLMANVFQTAGYTVDSAANAHEAFAKLENQPDLVTIDLVMPDITGWDVVEEVCSRPNAPACVLVSGRSEADTHTMRRCVAGVVQKPFVPRELLEVCEMVLRKRKTNTRPEVERRRVERRDFVMDVRVAPNVGMPLLNGKVVDLSPLGAEIELPASMSAGDTLRLAMRFPGRGRPMLVDGRIQHCTVRDGIWACGLEFRNLSPETRHDLSILLDIPAPTASQ